MPDVDLQQKAILPSSLNITQQPHSHNIIQPVIILIARLKHNSQLQPTLRLRGPRSLQQNIRAVVRAQIVPRVGAEDTRLRICEAPVGAEVEDFACWEGQLLGTKS